MRCPDCNKFVSMENGDPEVDRLEVEMSGNESYIVTMEASLVRNCAECSTELKRTMVDSEQTVVLEVVERECLSTEAEDGIHDPVIDEKDSSVDESGGRYAKNMISCTVTYTVTCNNGGCALQKQDTISAETNAGSFEESV